MKIKKDEKKRRKIKIKKITTRKRSKKRKNKKMNIMKMKMNSIDEKDIHKKMKRMITWKCNILWKMKKTTYFPFSM